VILIAQGVLDRKNASPGMSKKIKVVPIEVECLADLLDLIDEAGDRPELVSIG
jgi:hypothetical protein